MRVFDPAGKRLARLFGNLEQYGPVGLLLHDDYAWKNAPALRNVTDTRTDKVAAARLAVDGEVE